MAGIQDEDLAEMMSMREKNSQKQQGEKSSPFNNLKREFEKYEKELKETVNDYESSLYFDILTSTRQRIKLLEELDEARDDSTIIGELRNRIDEVKKKVWMAKSLINQQKTEISQSLSKGSVTKPLNRFEQSVSKMTKTTLMQRVHRFQDMIGNVVGYFLVLMLSNETFREKSWRIWNDILFFFQGIVAGWKEDLQKKDQQYYRAGTGQRHGFIMRFILWNWSWVPWSLDSAKRIIVWGTDYLGYINQGQEPLRGKVMHVVHDAQRTLHTKQEQMKKGIHESLKAGKEIAQHPMEYLPVSDNVKSKLRGVIGGGGSEVELKRRGHTSTEAKGAETEVSKR